MAKGIAKLDQPPETHEARMSFSEHLEELRKRFFYAALGALVAIVVCTYYAWPIVGFIVQPYQLALHWAGYNASFVYPGPADVILIWMSIGFKVGLILASPWIIYQLWKFISAGLYPRERRIVYKYVGPSIFLFLLGVAFLFFLVLPITLRFLVNFTAETALPIPHAWPLENFIFNHGQVVDFSSLPGGDQVKLPEIPVVKSDPAAFPAGPNGAFWYNAVDGKIKARVAGKTIELMSSRQGALFTPLPRLEDYLGFVTFMALLFGACFEMPLVVMVLAQIDLVRVATFRKARKYVYFGLLVAAVVAAPTPDWVTISVIYLPMLMLYELGIFLAALTVRRRQQADN